MSAKLAKRKSSRKDIPETLEHDELDNFIRYQDEVLERNTQELRRVIEDQEERLEKQMRNQDEKTNRYYLKDDPMDSQDERLQKKIHRIDENISDRIEELDRKTDEYMVELSRRNAQWKNRLEDIGENMAVNSRHKSSISWDERMHQKHLNRDHRPGHSSPDDDGSEIWDTESIRGQDPRNGYQEEIIEVIEESERDQQRRQVHVAQPVKRTKTTTGELQRPHGVQQRPQYKRQIPQARMVGTRSAQSPPAHVSSPPLYPCPYCKKPLVYYDKYQRWWCRSCKKWRESS